MAENDNCPKGRTALNFLVDLVSFAVLMFLVTTGILMKFILPPGTGGKLSVWGLDRHQWGEFHFWLAAAFFALMAYHVWLHWKWIVAVVTGKKPLGAGAVVYPVAAAVVIVLAVAPILSPVKKEGGGRRGEFKLERSGTSETAHAAALEDECGKNGQHGRRKGNQASREASKAETKTDEAQVENDGHQEAGHHGKREGNEEVRGSMTLREVEEATGVPASHIIRELNLPPSVTPDDRLGHLRKSYGFEMEKVRMIVEAYEKKKGGEGAPPL